MNDFIESVTFEIWWMNIPLAAGYVVLGLIVFGIPLWTLASKFRWRRRDAADIAAHEALIRLARGSASEVGSHRG